MTKEPIKIGLLGPGLVGKAFLKQLEQYTGQEFQLSFIANSKHMVMTNKKVKAEQLLSALQNQEFTSTNEIIKQENQLGSFPFQYESQKSFRKFILIDCTSSQNVAEHYPTFLQIGISVIACNKKAFSSSHDLFSKIMASSTGPDSKAFCQFESTVGAGLPVIRTLKSLLETGDEVVKVEGLLSGTLAFVYDSFCADPTSTFSKIISIAKEKGYTEPDPRDDLYGMDVGRKLLILSRLMSPTSGLEMEQVEVENIVPEALRQLDVESFMKEMPQKMDLKMEKLKQEAFNKNQVLRYIGTITKENQKVKQKVSLQMVPKDSGFGNLKGSDNRIVFYTKRFPNGLVIQGAGAGADVTAYGIMSDLLEISSKLALK